MQKFHLAWNDKRHCLGIAEIDDQHRGLVELTNALSEAVEQGCDLTQTRLHMDGILHFTINHFRHEEDLMRAHDFPGLKQHAAEHAKLVAEVRTMITGLTPDNPGRALLITAFLTDCVERHIQQADLALAQHLLKKGLS